MMWTTERMNASNQKKGGEMKDGVTWDKGEGKQSECHRTILNVEGRPKMCIKL